MFTDMVGYSALTQRDEALALELLEEHRVVIRETVLRYGGREVKTIGDGFLLEFPSTLSAMEAAVQIQQALHTRNENSPHNRQVRVRIGIHVGDVVARDGDIHGDGVNIAARLEPLAMGGGICVSEDVERAVRNKLACPLAPLGSAELKNIDLPVSVFRVVLPWDSSAPSTPPVIAAADPAAPAKSVAVLAFANLSTDRDNEYFSDGISEELLNVLAKIPELKVSARTSAFFFKGKQVPISEIAKQLGVAYVVEGSVRKAGDRLRITAQLINAADGFHLWSDTFDRDAKDVFAVQDEIAGLIARNLSIKLAASPVAARSVNPEAHRLLLEGRYHLAQRTEDGFTRAEKALARAVEIDPTFAPPLAALGELYAVRSQFQAFSGRGADHVDRARAVDRVNQAMRLDPLLAEPYAVMALLLVNDRRLPEAEVFFEKTFRLNPNNAIAHHWRANLRMLQGRLEEGLAGLEEALRLNPLSFITVHAYGAYLNYAGKFDEALSVIDHSLALRSEGHYGAGHSERALVLLRLGRTDEAVVTARGVLQSIATAILTWSGGDAVYVLRAAGVVDEAERFASDLLGAVPPASYLRGYILCALGRFDEGLPLLESAPPIALARLYLLPMLDPARDTPRFQEWIAKLGVAEDYRRARESIARLEAERKAADSR